MRNKGFEETEKVRLDEKVRVISIAPWDTGAPRKTTLGDICVAPKGFVSLSREEVIAQGQSGNKLLTGTDGNGSHATWYIEDAYCRKELGFEVENESQHVLNKELVKKMFDFKTQSSFEKNIEKNVVTRAEKALLMELIKELNLNDYQKIDYCIRYTGMKL